MRTLGQDCKINHDVDGNGIEGGQTNSHLLQKISYRYSTSHMCYIIVSPVINSQTNTFLQILRTFIPKYIKLLSLPDCSSRKSIITSGSSISIYDFIHSSTCDSLNVDAAAESPVRKYGKHAFSHGNQILERLRNNTKLLP